MDWPRNWARTAQGIYLPNPGGAGSASALTLNILANTTSYFGRVRAPVGGRVTSVSLQVTAVTLASPLRISLYSDDGQVRLTDVTTASLTTTGLKTTALTQAVELEAGKQYYLGMVATGALNITVMTHRLNGISMAAAAGKRELSGTNGGFGAGVLPATFNPDTDLTYSDNGTLFTRWDT